MRRESGRDRSRADEANDRRRDGRHDRAPPNPGTWLLSTALQTVVAVVGLVIVLFALGRAVGVDLLGAAAGALSTHTGQWLAIALVALLAMSAAVRTLRYARAP